MLITLRENLQKNFVWSLRDLKNIDAPDLLKRCKGNKDENAIKSLVNYVTVDEHGKLSVN